MNSGGATAECPTRRWIALTEHGWPPTLLVMNKSKFVRDGMVIAYHDSAPDNREKPVVLLLHGFPDRAEMWSAQVTFLVARGFRVLAPDLRGYGDSAIASRTADYHWSEVLGDLLGLLDHLGVAQADVVGHDWGAAIAWLLAGRYPARVRRLVVISVGHPMAYARAGLAQKLRSWYILYFMLAGLAERLLRLPFFPGFRSVFRSHPDADEVMARMRAPGRWRAALRLYRANLLSMLLGQHPKARADTLGIHSRDDRYLVASQMIRSERWVHGRWRYVGLPGGHWIPLEQPDALNALLAEHLGVAG